jgi:hypothetical protein
MTRTALVKAAAPATGVIDAQHVRCTPAAAIADPALLAPAFSGTSWDTWRAVLKAAYAEPLTDGELTLFKSVAGHRAPPTRQVKELVVIVGRRGGKDSIASAIATTAAMADYGPHLRPGERASILCLAVDRSQARIVNRYIKGYFATVPLLAPLVVSDNDDGLELSNGNEVVIATNSFRAIRGRTVACAVLDEVAFWRDETAANPDVEIYTALMPSTVTIPGAVVVMITTAHRRSGLAFTKWTRHFGKDDDNVLVVYGETRQFNPLVPQEIIDDALSRDPEAAAAEWLSQWRSDLSDFLDRELVDSAIDPGVVVRPPVPSTGYVAFADPSGGRGDSFTMALAHGEGNVAVLDLTYEKRAPFDPSVVVGEIADLLRSYGVGEVTGDRYAAGWVTEGFAKAGIHYRQSERDRSAVYLDSLPLFTAGRCRLLDQARLTYQLVSLERRAVRGGRDRVDHPPGGADDVANSACGALVLAADSSAPALWRPTPCSPRDTPHPGRHPPRASSPRWQRTNPAATGASGRATPSTAARRSP